jgi:methylated-DNA-protein-cysteine methyltransferase-like protein
LTLIGYGGIFSTLSTKQGPIVQTEFTKRVCSIITAIPRGCVATYGQIAALAGNPRSARQVAWILHSSSERYRLPWHRVIGGGGTISLPRGRGYEEQKSLLLGEGVSFNAEDRIDIRHYGWRPGKVDVDRGM